MLDRLVQQCLVGVTMGAVGSKRLGGLGSSLGQLPHTLAQLADQSCNHKSSFNSPILGEASASLDLEKIIVMPSEVPV